MPFKNGFLLTRLDIPDVEGAFADSARADVPIADVERLNTSRFAEHVPGLQLGARGGVPDVDPIVLGARNQPRAIGIEVETAAWLLDPRQDGLSTIRLQIPNANVALIYLVGEKSSIRTDRKRPEFADPEVDMCLDDSSVDGIPDPKLTFIVCQHTAMIQKEHAADTELVSIQGTLRSIEQLVEMKPLPVAEFRRRCFKCAARHGKVLRLKSAGDGGHVGAKSFPPFRVACLVGLCALAGFVLVTEPLTRTNAVMNTATVLIENMVGSGFRQHQRTAF